MPAIVAGTEAGVCTLRLDRPEVLNAFDLEMLRELRALADAAALDPQVRAIVLTGGPRAFCTGEDLRAARVLDQGGFGEQIVELQELATTLRAAPKPVLAAIAGPAYGGGLELALDCDVRIAARSARFACPEPRWALSITNGASLLLRRTVGEGWARELALLGTVLDADTALRIGLVTRVVEDADLEAAARAAVAPVLEMDAEAVRRTKELLNAEPRSWQDVLDHETEAVLDGFADPAAQQRLAGFGRRA